jgi:hypothetical protein
LKVYWNKNETKRKMKQMSNEINNVKNLANVGQIGRVGKEAWLVNVSKMTFVIINFYSMPIFPLYDCNNFS